MNCARLRTVAAALCLVLAAATLAPAEVTPFRFVHASDTHFTPHRTADSNAVKNARMFEEISALDPKPAFAVCTGDIVEVGAPVEYGYLKEALAKLTIPFHPAPGNHDVRWNPLGKEGFVKGTGHPLYQTWDYNGVQFFLLDSTVLLEHWGHISQQQLDWLKAELEKVGTEKPVVIGFHHWIGRDRRQVDNEQELMELVDPYNVVLWLQGHGHSDIQWEINGVPAIMQKGLYQGSYSVIDVQKDKLVVTRRSLKTPKQQEELIRDKSVPPTEEVVWTKVGEYPLKRPGKGQRLLFRARLGISQENPFIRKVALNAAVQSRLLRAGDALYVTTMGGELIRIDAKRWIESEPGVTYRKRSEGPPIIRPQVDPIVWRFKAGDSIFSTPHVQGDVAYIGSADHHVYAVNLADGTKKWGFKTDGAVLAGAAVAKGVVCIGSADTTIYGLDADTGSVRWKVQGGNLYQSKAATDGSHFFVGGWDNYFRCIDAETGREVWKLYLGREQKLLPQFSAFAPAIASPAVAPDHGLVYVSTNDGILHAIDIATGEHRWKIDRKKMGYSSPLYHDGVVYGCLSDESKVFAADAKTGEIKWEKETGRVVYDSSFCWANGLVAIGCVDGTLLAFSAETGEKAWEYNVDHGHLLASPAADDNFVYIATMLGRVNAVPIRQ